MLSLRRRGKSGTFYIRGSVTLGTKSIVVKEFSSGTSDKDAASHLMAEHEVKLRHQLMFGAKAELADATVADAFLTYLSKSPKPCSADVLRVGKMNEVIGDHPLNDPTSAWNDFRKERLQNHALGGQDRYRGALQAAINSHHEAHGQQGIKIPTIKFKNARVRFLDRIDRDRLINSYHPRLQPLIVMLAFHGPRIQTALQIKWGAQGVDMTYETICFDHTKTSTIQSVPMHPKVKEALLPIWEKQGRPRTGHVFLNRFGQPYQNTRLAKIQGGNPIKNQHATACKRAGIEDFRVHDWRHHWASHCVMAGIDLVTIMRMGGWSSLRMVQRYAAVDTDHMRASVNKLT